MSDLEKMHPSEETLTLETVRLTGLVARSMVLLTRGKLIA